MTCKHNCFECPYDDCINDTITTTERMESAQRDKNFMNYGVTMVNGNHRRARQKYDKR